MVFVLNRQKKSKEILTVFFFNIIYYEAYLSVTVHFIPINYMYFY